MKESKRKDSTLTIGTQKLEIMRRKMISKGLYGAVFQGKFQGRNVAVKRVQHIDVDDNHHEKIMKTHEELQLPYAHPNVLHLLHHEQDFNFR